MEKSAPSFTGQDLSELLIAANHGRPFTDEELTTIASRLDLKGKKKDYTPRISAAAYVYRQYGRGWTRIMAAFGHVRYTNVEQNDVYTLGGRIRKNPRPTFVVGKGTTKRTCAH